MLDFLFICVNGHKLELYFTCCWVSEDWVKEKEGKKLFFFVFLLIVFQGR